MDYVRLPKVVKLHKYISQTCLVETQRLCWLATDDKESPLYSAIQGMIPDSEDGERAMRTEAITEIGEIIAEAAAHGGTTKGPHVAIPGYVPLENFISRVVLEELWRLTWLATDSESPLYDEIQDRIPGDEEYRTEARKALKAIGIIAQKARRKCV
ncbi:MAG: hypothetical protein ABIF77_00070 [bacterium]